MKIEPLSPEHNRLAFTCGDDKLDRYLHENASQARKKGLAATFVAVRDDAPGSVLGFYCLSNFLISGLTIPDVLRKKRNLPTHSVAATLLGKLAVAKLEQGKGIGTELLANALQKAYGASANVASVCVVVDAVDESAVRFYEGFGFLRVPSQDLRLVIMMDTIGKALPGISDFAQRSREDSA